jgi:NADPH:quinone reductase-like Zn-dependent oxidoreductase
MKAITIHEFGGPEVLRLGEVEIPILSDGDLLVKVYASSVNPVDWKIREGLRHTRFPVKFPLTMGLDLSGVVVGTGNAVTEFQVGDSVYGRPDPLRNGAFAEYIAVKADIVALKPRSIDHINASALPLAGLTAWQALFEHGDLRAGEKVLIHAASGGVGSLAVQLAKWKGAYVIGTTSEKNIDFVKSLGADEVINYRTEKFHETLSEIDLVLDTVGGETQKDSLQVLKQSGRLITTLAAEYIEAAQEKNIYLKSFTTMSYPADLRQMAELVDTGKLRPIIAAVMPIEETIAAEKIVEDGHTVGKIVIQIC